MKLTLTEFAERCGFTRQRVHQLIKADAIEYSVVTTGKLAYYLIDASELKKIVHKRRKKPAQKKPKHKGNKNVY